MAPKAKIGCRTMRAWLRGWLTPPALPAGAPLPSAKPVGRLIDILCELDADRSER